MLLSKSHSVFLILASLAAGCAELVVPEPALEEVCQAENLTECIPWALAGTATELHLIGQHFHPGFDVDLASDGAPGLDSFTALVGDVALERPALAPGRIPGREVLAGLLPNSVEMGIYDVELETPAGQLARLPDAFRITSPLEVVAVPESARIPSGHTLGLSVSFENLGSEPLNPVEIDLSQEGSGRFALPGAPEPFEVGAYDLHRLDLELQATSHGVATILLGVRASTSQGISVAPGEPVRLDLLVLQPASLSVSAQVSPQATIPGEEFELVVAVSCRGETAALEVGLAEPQLSGSGSVELDPLPSQPMDIPPESTRSLRWTGTAVSPGNVQLVLSVVGREAISGRPLGPVLADPIVLEIQ